MKAIKANFVLPLVLVLSFCSILTITTISNAQSAVRVFNVNKSVVSNKKADEILSILRDYNNTCYGCRYSITGLKEMRFLRSLTANEIESWKQQNPAEVNSDNATVTDTSLAPIIVDAHYMWQSVKQVKYFNSIYIVITYKKQNENTYYLVSHLVDNRKRGELANEFSVYQNTVFQEMDSKWTIKENSVSTSTSTSGFNTNIEYESRGTIPSSLAFLFGSIIMQGLNNTANEILHNVM